MATRRFSLSTTVSGDAEAAIEFLADLPRHVGLHPFLVSATVTASGDDPGPWRDFEIVERPRLWRLRYTMRFPVHVERTSPTSLRSDVLALRGCRLTSITTATRPRRRQRPRQRGDDGDRSLPGRGLHVQERPYRPRPHLRAPRRAPGRRLVTRLLAIAGIAVGTWVIACLVMVLLARRLPDGLLKQVLEFLPSCVTAARTLRRDPVVPRRAKVALPRRRGVGGLAHRPDARSCLPVIGPLDDVVAVVLLMRYAARSIPRETCCRHGPRTSRLLERLLGSGRPGPTR